ncbi:MAG: hypothetical protein GY729_15640, partial [Desulfobacteraceae bacterium]|nr:hypothetical protein [Desulfobacteraceae bacterium]
VTLFAMAVCITIIAPASHANTIWGWQMDNHKTDQSMTFSNGTQG